MIIVLNNKSNLTKEEFINYQNKLKELEKENIILCPSTIHLGSFSLKNIVLGAQNVSCEECGAYTGEVSASQLSSYNVKYCIIGHSERRLNQKETNEEINKKVKQLLKYNITPIICVGETKTEKENNETLSIIKTQLKEAINGLSIEEKEKIIIAYEPIWAIGSGILPTISEITIVLSAIKSVLPTTGLLYGGSVTEENVEMLKKCEYINGFLLGGLSLKLENLQKFLKKMTN